MSAIDFVEDNHLQWACSNAAYHGDLTHDSHSSIDLFIESIKQYAARRVFCYAQSPPPDDNMIFGSLFHKVVLEEGQLDDEYIVQEKYDRRTKAGKAAHLRFIEKAALKTIVSMDQSSMAYAMADGVSNNQVAEQLLFSDGGIHECSFRWTDRMTGCPLKMRIDKLLMDGTVVDLKTTHDVRPDAWSRTVHKFGYHRQAAMYLDGLETLGISKDMPFIFLACSKTPPHECVCYELDYNALALGRSENLAAMVELADRRRRDDWSGRWSNKINKVSLPAYAFPRS